MYKGLCAGGGVNPFFKSGEYGPLNNETCMRIEESKLAQIIVILAPGLSKWPLLVELLFDCVKPCKPI